MEPIGRPKVKICCIASIEEAELALRYGASALGLVSEMPSGPGVISEALIAAIAAAAPSKVETFLLTCKQSAEDIIAQHRRCRTTTIQLVDVLTVGNYADLRAALPEIRLVQVIHVTGPESVPAAVAAAPLVDAILLDSGNPALQVKELGGTGRIHDWSLSRQIRTQISAPMYLAGGLRPENVAQAIAVVQPFGLDICSGVRTNGNLDEDKLARFFQAVASV